MDKGNRIARKERARATIPLLSIVINRRISYLMVLHLGGRLRELFTGRKGSAGGVWPPHKVRSTAHDHNTNLLDNSVPLFYRWHKQWPLQQR
jgi:hypothetical protein